MLDYILSHPVLLATGPCVILGVVLLCMLLKRQKQRRKDREYAQMQRRDDALNEALRNNLVSAQVYASAKPVDIQWDDQAVNEGWETRSRDMLELVEYSAYSRKKYTFPADRPLKIGSGRENQMVIQRTGVEKQHCELFPMENRMAVRSLFGAPTLLERGKNVYEVDGEGVYLAKGDMIRIGEAKVQYRPFKD